MDINKRLQAKIKENENEYLDILFVLLKQPSVSTTKYGVEDCAYLLQKIMKNVGIDTHLYKT